MHSQLHSATLQAIRTHRMCAAGDRVAVALSGGADSVALFLLLSDLRAELGITLAVAHFNHGLRGADSDADQAFAAELAAKHECPFYGAKEDVAAAAAREGGNVEQAGRLLRYGFFQSLVSDGRAACVAVAHTADDQAETVLAHLLRGTGLTGLAGIYPVAGPVIRPLLSVRRAALREFLAGCGQTWREDATNQDVTRLRARIRHVLLPLMERDFQPAATDHLASLADLARGEEELWRKLMNQILEKHAVRSAARIEIGIAGLFQPLELLPAESSLAVTRRIVRRLVEAVGGHRRRLSSEHVEQVIRLARESSSGHCVQLPGGVEVARTFDRLSFALRGDRETRPESGPHGTTPASESYEYVVELPASGGTRVDIAEIGSRLCLNLVDWPTVSGDTILWGQALDSDLLRAPLFVRNWRPGDAYRPRGHRGVHKLKQLFLHHRIAAPLRRSWPVLTSAGRVVWARQVGSAEEFSAGARTRCAVVITEQAL